MASFVASKSKNLEGSIKVPGDKSISHRSIMLGSIANGETHISGFLQGEDSLATLNAFKEMGVDIKRNGSNVIIKGVGMHGLQEPLKPLDLGNSGTSIRLMAGLLSAQSFNTELTGDDSLSKRPMARVIEPLSQMGAKITGPESKPPLSIIGGQKLSSLTYTLPVASAQIKSCLLLAGLYAEGETCIIENAVTRDHTERMLKGFGYKVNSVNGRVSLSGQGELKACNIEVPSDISSSAFFMVAASIAENADITLEAVNINPTRTGIISILKLMGAKITFVNKKKYKGEVIADIFVRSATKLIAINCPSKFNSAAIDEMLLIFLVAAKAKGVSYFKDLSELNQKESPRLEWGSKILNMMGIKTKLTNNSIKIYGNPKLEISKKIMIKKYLKDHRVFMMSVIAAFTCGGKWEIYDPDSIKTSFPSFLRVIKKIKN